jgi:hypothetical protein
MLRITTLVALLLALLLFSAPASADNGKHHDKKDKAADSTEAEPEPSADSTDGSSGDSNNGVEANSCRAVGVQLTPPPPQAGVDEECLPPFLDLPGFLRLR